MVPVPPVLCPGGDLRKTDNLRNLLCTENGNAGFVGRKRFLQKVTFGSDAKTDRKNGARYMLAPFLLRLKYKRTIIILIMTKKAYTLFLIVDNLSV
jgi:hypothetical protein